MAAPNISWGIKEQARGRHTAGVSTLPPCLCNGNAPRRIEMNAITSASTNIEPSQPYIVRASLAKIQAILGCKEAASANNMAGNSDETKFFQTRLM